MTDTAGLHVKTNHDAPLTIEEVEARVQDRRARHRSHARISAVIYPIMTVIGTLVAWEVGVRVFGIPAYLLPAPSKIVVSFAEHAGLLLKHGWVTTIEIVLGYLLSIVVGVPLALRHFHVAGIFPLGAAAPGLVAGHAEGCGCAAASGLVRVRPASEGADRVSHRVLSDRHQHGGRARIDRAGEDPSRALDGARRAPRPSSRFVCRARCLRSSAASRFRSRWPWSARWSANSSAAMPGSAICSWWRTAAWIRRCCLRGLSR